MGRPRKPTAKHKKDGSYRPCLHDGRADLEVCGGPVGSPPAGLSVDGVRLWRLVVDSLPEHTVQTIDESALESLCRWFAQWRSCMDLLESIGPIDDYYPKLIRAADTAHKNFVILASRFGLTPADRAKLKTGDSEGDKEKNPFEVLKAFEALEDAS